MLVDEPEGSGRGYDGEKTGYKPTHIMRYGVCAQSILGEYMC